LRALAAGQGMLSAILYTIARDMAIDDLDSLGRTVLTHACEARPGRRRARAAERN
jgi:thiamine pyrophosphokinase